MADDLVYQTTTTAGTGPYTLVSVNGKRDFSDTWSTGGTEMFKVFMQHRTAAEWQIAWGHLSAANTLVIDRVVRSSNADAAVSFTAGTIDVTNDIGAAQAVEQSSATNFYMAWAS